jgi:hypothetical protein
MFTSLIGIHGILHAHIRAGNLIDDRFWKYRDILGLVPVRFLPFHPTEFQKIVPLFMNVR